MSTKIAVKHVVWIVIVLAIVAYFLNSYIQRMAKEKAELEKEQSIISTVEQMVLRFNAVNDWPERLTKGEKIRIGKIMTIELENLWIGPNPILFIGSIQDVSTLDEESYRLLIRRTVFDNTNLILFTEIGLELKCSKHMIDSFLSIYPQLFSSFEFMNSVAIVAKIDHIKTEFFKDNEGNKEEIKVGVGDCLDIVYTDRVQF